MSAVDEWANVRANDKDASVGWIFSIMGEKHDERRVPEADKEYNARIVFAGNNIQTASVVPPHELFQEVSSAPAEMASVRATLAVGALRSRRSPQVETDDAGRRPGVHTGQHSWS